MARATPFNFGIRDKLSQRGIRAVSYGVVEIPNNEAAARKIFEFAKKLDLYAITTGSVDSLDLIESLAKEYDMFVAIAHQPKRLTTQGTGSRQVEDGDIRFGNWNWLQPSAPHPLSRSVARTISTNWRTRSAQ